MRVFDSSAGSVGAGSAGAGSVGAGSVGAGSVGAGSVGAGSVGAGSVGAGSVGAGSVGAGSVGAGSVGAGSAGAGSVGAGSVGAGSAGGSTGAGSVGGGSTGGVPCILSGIGVANPSTETASENARATKRVRWKFILVKGFRTTISGDIFMRDSVCSAWETIDSLDATTCASCVGPAAVPLAVVNRLASRRRERLNAIGRIRKRSIVTIG